MQFDFATIEAATNKFSDDNKLGEGGFGQVYKVHAIFFIICLLFGDDSTHFKEKLKSDNAEALDVVIIQRVRVKLF